MATLLLASSCSGVKCPDFESPCPDPVELGGICDEGNCEIDGEPAGSRCNVVACLLKRGEVLSIPVSEAFAAAGGKDLQISTGMANCPGDNVRPEDVTARLDGVDGVTDSYMATIAVQWESLPASPMVLEISYMGQFLETTECADFYLSLVDIECLRENPGPSGCI